MAAVAVVGSAAQAASADMAGFVAIVDFAVMAASAITAGNATITMVLGTITVIAYGAMVASTAAKPTLFHKGAPSTQVGGVACCGAQADITYRRLSDRFEWLASAFEGIAVKFHRAAKSQR